MTLDAYESIEAKNHLGDVLIRDGDPLERLVREAFFAGYDAGQRYMVARARDEISFQTWFDAMKTYAGLQDRINVRLEAIKKIEKEEKSDDGV